MKNRKKIIIALSVCGGLAAIALCLWFFWLKDYFAFADATPIYVNSVASITSMDTGMSPRYSGIVEPQATYKIKKDDTKTLAKTYVAVGDEVHVGDQLFEYDTQEMQMQLEQAKLDLERIANQISTYNSQKKTLEAEKKKVSEDEQYAYTVQIQSVELQIQTEEYNSSVKKNEIEKFTKDLENAVVLSEVEGVIKEINTTPKTDATGQQLPFISVLSVGAYRIKGTLTELNQGNISVGQAVVIHSRVDNTAVWKGVVETIDFENPVTDNSAMYYGGGVADSGTKSSKYNFYVTLNSLDGLILGQHVYIEPDDGNVETKAGIWLPASYVVPQDNTGSCVWVQNDSKKLEKRNVILGSYDKENDKYQIKEGLSLNDFIAYPDTTLQEGMPTTADASAAPLPNQGGTQGEGAGDTTQYDQYGNVISGGTESSGGPTDSEFTEGEASSSTDDSADALNSPGNAIIGGADSPEMVVHGEVQMR